MWADFPPSITAKAKTALTQVPTCASSQAFSAASLARAPNPSSDPKRGLPAAHPAPGCVKKPAACWA